MNAIELDAIAHDGQITVNIPEAYHEQWNERTVRVIIISRDEKPGKSVTATDDFNPLEGSIIFEGDVVSPIHETWNAEQTPRTDQR